MDTKVLYHRCGQPLDVAEALEGRTNRFIFLDALTGDGFDRCPRCEKLLAITDFRVQNARVVSLAKVARKAPSTGAREGRRLVAKARRVRKQRSAA